MINLHYEVAPHDQPISSTWLWLRLAGPLHFRNAARIKFTALQVDMDAVLRDTTDYLKSNPRELYWQRLNASSIAQRLISELEPRDRTVGFFIRALTRGRHVLRYQLRAESPGNFKALPATVEAVYAPELNGDSEDKRLEIFSR
jgi:hypothetical protein